MALYSNYPCLDRPFYKAGMSFLGSVIICIAMICFFSSTTYSAPPPVAVGVAQTLQQSQALQQSKTVILTNKTRHINLLDHAVLNIDWQKRKQLPDILEDYKNGRIAPINNTEQISYSPAHFWYRFTITNNSGRENWLLDFGSNMIEATPHYDLINIFDFESINAIYALSEDVSHQKNAAIQIPTGTTKTIIMLVRPSAGFFFKAPVQLLSATDAQIVLKQQNIRLNIAFFILALIMGLGFAVYILQKNKASLYIIPYIGSAFLIYAHFEGFLSLPLDINLARFGVLNALFLVSALFLSKAFLPKTKFSKIYDLFHNVLYGLLCCYVLGILVAQNLSFTAVILFSFLPSLIFLCLCITSFISSFFHKITTPAFFFAWLSILVGATMTKLYETNIITIDAQDHITALLYQNAFWIGLLLNVFFLHIQYVYSLYLDEKNLKDLLKEEKEDLLNKEQMRRAKEAADQAQLVRVLKREKELMEELRTRDQEKSEALSMAKKAADDANEAKSAFLAVISHEIRTPMTGIMGMVRLLKDSVLDNQQEEYAETIQQSGESLLSLLNDILDFSKIESGHMSIENIDFDIRKLIHSVALLMGSRAEEKGLRLIEEIGSDVPLALKGDPTRLRQILLNLIGNAVKFTDEGSVKIQVNIQRRMPEKNKLALYFAVEDTGIGIDEDGQKRLFNPFSQADNTISRRFGGTGLGLAICKKLVEAMHGTIAIDSEAGKGSVFYFVVPLEPGNENAIVNDQDSKIDLPPLSILIVDDNEINQKVVTGLLAKYKHKTIAVSNGLEAVNAVKDNDIFDVILMDMEMPVMNGVEATQEIRRLDDPEKSQTPIIAMTANVVNEDIEKCRAAGMNDYTSKPINPDKMFTAIANILYATADDAEQKTMAPPILDENNTPEESEHISDENILEDQTVENDLDVFNTALLQDLKETLGADELNELCKDVVDKSALIIEEMSGAMKENDMDTLMHKTHDLKGMTGNFGLSELARLALEIENASKNNDIPTIEETLMKMGGAVERADAAMKEWTSA